MKPKTKRITYQKVLLFWSLISLAVLIAGLVFGPDKHDGKVYVNLPVVLTGIAMLVVGDLIITIAMFVSFVKAVKAYNRYLTENNIDERAEEEAFKNYINQTRHNQEAMAFRTFSLWLRANQNAPKDKSFRSYFNLVLVILFLCCLVAFMPLMAWHLVAGLSTLGTAFGIIILLLIINVTHDKMAANRKNIDYNLPTQIATVISCSINSESSYGFGSDYYGHQTNRILSTTYLIHLDVAGETKKAYSKTYYNKGEKVEVYQNRKLKDAVIIKEEK